MPIFYDNKLIRRDIYRENYLNINTIFSKNKQKDNITKVISFFEKTKVFERVCKLSKRDISPNRSTKRKREKKSEMDHPKKKKRKTITQPTTQSLTHFYRQNLKYGKYREFFKKIPIH